MATATTDATTIKRRLLETIRIEQADAGRQAYEMRIDPRKSAYAPLFERAVRFWSDLAYTVNNDLEPDTREQGVALAILRRNVEKGA